MGESRLRIRQPPFDLQNENNAQEVPLEKDYVPSGFTIEDSLSKELMKLSFNDRIAIQEELHGVRCRAANETPELIAKSLYKFDVQIVARRDELQKQYQATGSFQRDMSSSNNNNNNNSDTFSANSSSTKYDFSNQQNPLRNIRSMSKSPFSSNNSGNKTQQQQQNNKPSGIHSSNCQPLNQQVEDCYVNDPNVRLRFLRCECFDVPKAVDRFVNFLELACELYGDYAAERPIHIRDFASRQEEVVLQNSRNQYLPFRDRSGRRVLIGVGTCDFNIRYDLRFKILFYLHWVASEDVETQQKGVVIVAWPCDEATPNGGGSTATDSNNDVRLTWEKVLRPQMNKRLVELHKKMNRAMPVRITANHGYFPDTPFHRALSTLYYFGMESRQRRLYKAHHGAYNYHAIAIIAQIELLAFIIYKNGAEKVPVYYSKGILFHRLLTILLFSTMLYFWFSILNTTQLQATPPSFDMLSLAMALTSCCSRSLTRALSNRPITCDGSTPFVPNTIETIKSARLMVEKAEAIRSTFFWMAMTGTRLSTAQDLETLSFARARPSRKTLATCTFENSSNSHTISTLVPHEKRNAGLPGRFSMTLRPRAAGSWTGVCRVKCGSWPRIEKKSEKRSPLPTSSTIGLP